MQVTAEWAPGKYSSMFSDAKASTHPVLELSTDILKHLAHSDACKKRMHELYLVSTLDRLLLTEELVVREHVLKVLWVLRDHDKAVESAKAISSHVDTLRRVSDTYGLTAHGGKISRSVSKLARRLQVELAESKLKSDLTESWAWMKESIFVDDFAEQDASAWEQQIIAINAEHENEMADLRQSLLRLQVRWEKLFSQPIACVTCRLRRLTHK